jgi:putative spermidine/putrescine transport system substrate-binding protein
LWADPDAVQAGQLERGRVLQAGGAAALYDRPDTLAIARLLGPANVLAGIPAGRAEPLRVAVGMDVHSAYAAALTQAVVRPVWAATHQRIALVAVAAPLVDQGWDVARLDPFTLTDGCAAHRLRVLDWGQLGGRARFVAGAASDCGVGATLSSTVLTWEPAKLKAAPGWADFWDVARLPGRRGLRAGPIGTLEIALMADGVAPGAVYATLASKDGVARAFRKLDQLRPYIVWWRSDAEPMAMLARGQVLMSSAPSAQVALAAAKLHRGFGVQWNGAIASVQSWAIRAVSARAAEAMAFINATEDARVAAVVFARTGLGGTLAGAPLAAPDAGSPAAHAGQALTLDVGFWHDHAAALSKRFDAWLKH